MHGKMKGYALKNPMPRLSLARVRKNAGSKGDPSYVRSEQVFEVQWTSDKDEDLIKFCEERDRLQSLMPDLPSNMFSDASLRGRWTVLDENQLEVQL
jgi:hypothetical protein